MSITAATELNRIETDAARALRLEIRVEIIFSGSGSAEILERCARVLLTVLPHREKVDETYDENRDFDCEETVWLEKLPSWFTMNLSASGEGWSLSSWLYWLLSAHEDRDWYWTGYKVLSSDEACLELAVETLPIQWGALKRLLECAGAKSVKLRV